MPVINQYADIGTGTGKTVLACVNQLAAQGQFPSVVLIDGLLQMLAISMRKVLSSIYNLGIPSPGVTPLVAGVFEEQQALRQTLL